MKVEVQQQRHGVGSAEKAGVVQNADRAHTSLHILLLQQPLVFVGKESQMEETSRHVEGCVFIRASNFARDSQVLCGPSPLQDQDLPEPCAQICTSRGSAGGFCERDDSDMSGTRLYSSAEILREDKSDRVQAEGICKLLRGHVRCQRDDVRLGSKMQSIKAQSGARPHFCLSIDSSLEPLSRRTGGLRVF